MSQAGNSATEQYAAETIGAVVGRVRRGEQTVADTAFEALTRASAHGAPASERFENPSGGPIDPVWIDRFSEIDLEIAATAAEAAGPHAPLLGVPVAVKGNIDVDGLPTTAACPSFASGPAEPSAAAVRRLEAAGAVIIGTTNLDQFATGLNGTRSPYGAPSAVGFPGYASGGSSSGSAVAVARGDVPLALGTDTAGSGRVPAALNGIVGLKPSKGLVSTAGVLPACRSLDCVSIFTADVDSAALALDVLAGPDPADGWSRTPPAVARVGVDAGVFSIPASADADPAPVLRIGVPSILPSTKIDPEAAAAWDAALLLIADLDVPGGVELVPMDLTSFYEAGAMLYGTAFVAERYASVGAFIEQRIAEFGEDDPSLDPTVRDIVLAGAAPTAAEAFTVIDRIRVLTAEAHLLLATVDALFTPTVLEHPTHEELAADPVGVNARLGTFTTFGNLLDLAVLSVPASPRADGLPFGVSFHAPAFSEQRLLSIGARWEKGVREAAGHPEATDDTVLLAVGGAHMAGLPANPELLAAGGEYLRLTRTDGSYRLHVLDTPVGPRPGIERVARGGAPVEVELWSIPSTQLGAFSAKVPPHLALGPVTLLDGTSALGFLGAASHEVADSGLVPSWRAFARGVEPTPA